MRHSGMQKLIAIMVVASLASGTSYTLLQANGTISGTALPSINCCCQKSCCGKKNCRCCNKTTSSKKHSSNFCDCTQETPPAELPKQNRYRNVVRENLVLSQTFCSTLFNCQEKKFFSASSKTCFGQAHSVPLTISQCVWLT
jgi:hypothetical protein